MTKISYPGVSYWSWSSNPADGAVDGVYMEPAAGQSMINMLSAYHAATGGYLAVNEGYRTFAGQVYWRDHGTGGTPGLSNHGMGQAFDFDPGSLTLDQHSWVIANCGQFGYEKLGSGVFKAYDWMHFNYKSAAAGPATEHKINKGDDDVQYWKYAANGRIVAIDNVRMQYRYLNQYELMVVANLVAAGITQVSTFSEPAWTNTLGGFKEIKTPL